MQLVVRPPWWRTTTAYFGYGVLVVLPLAGEALPQGEGLLPAHPQEVVGEAPRDAAGRPLLAHGAEREARDPEVAAVELMGHLVGGAAWK